jgi:hypothetical protein
MTEVTFSRPAFPNAQYPKVQNSEVDLPALLYANSRWENFKSTEVVYETSPVSIKASQARRIPKRIFRRGMGNAYASDSK